MTTPIRPRTSAKAWPLAAATAAAMLCVGVAHAHDDSITIVGQLRNAVGGSDAASQGVVGAERLADRPTPRPADVLEAVPGVVVSQHSGDAKANQYFLRGFNLDHGTDFATRVNGVPVNLPSHGHGQGYADLNFLIPELVARIDYQKGPYDAACGDFCAAGAADIRYQRSLDAPLAQWTLGPHRLRRVLFAASTVLGGDAAAADAPHALAAFEAMGNDGPWSVPQRLQRHNLVLGLATGSAAQSFDLGLMAYRARWTATDQVPERAIAAGLIGRYGSLDPSDGGQTQRWSLNAQWQRRGADDRSQISAWWLGYGLDLSSNFTYALERGAQGDQFTQTDHRHAVGLDARHTLDHAWRDIELRSEFGVQARHDRARVGLYDSIQRQISATVRDDDVRLNQLALHGQTSAALSERLRVVAGLRVEHVVQQVRAQALAANSGTARATQWLPKLSLIGGPFNLAGAKTEWFVNAGRGIHSNDARGATAQVDPRTGAAIEPVAPLVPLLGAELGLRSEPAPGLQTSLALWTLRSRSELLYLGDQGRTDAAAASRRVGVEWNADWRARRWLLLDAGLAFSRARFADGRHIPNTVDQVASLGASVRERGPWSGSLQLRWRGSGALTDDNRVRARPSLTANLRLAYRIGTRTTLALEAFNLFNRRFDDIQYVYSSRLPGEAEPVLDRHVHPAEARHLRLTLRHTL